MRTKLLNAFFCGAVIVVMLLVTTTTLRAEDINFGSLRDCTPTIDCSSQVTCNLQNDQRDCRECLIKNHLFGGCLAKGINPVCELEKAKRNAELIRQKSECEVEKSSQKLTCETRKAAEKAVCESAKQSEVTGAAGDEANLREAIISTYNLEPKSIPKAILAKLSPVFFEEFDEPISFITYNGDVSIPNILLTEFNSHGVIALQNIIVLKESNSDRVDIRTWVRGFVHLREFKRWGVNGVAQAYKYDAAKAARLVDAEVDQSCAEIRC